MHLTKRLYVFRWHKHNETIIIMPSDKKSSNIIKLAKLVKTPNINKRVMTCIVSVPVVPPN